MGYIAGSFAFPPVEFAEYSKLLSIKFKPLDKKIQKTLIS